MSTDTPAAPRAKLQRDFSQMELKDLLTLVNVFALAAPIAQNPIITKIAGEMLTQVAGKIGAQPIKGFEFDCIQSSITDIERALKSMMFIWLSVKENASALSFVTELGNCIQAEYLQRNGIPMPPLGSEFAGQREN